MRDNVKFFAQRSVIFGAILLSNGSVTGIRMITDSIIFADGDVECDMANDSLIIATGTVKAGILNGSVVLAGSDADVKIVASSVLRIRGAANLVNVTDKSHVVAKRGISIDGNIIGASTVTSEGPDPLQIIALFECKQVGVQVGIDAFKKGVVIESVEEGKPFAVAGLKKGDQVLAINGKASDAVEDFRRLVRRSLVGTGEAVLRVKRSGQTLELKVVFNR